VALVGAAFLCANCQTTWLTRGTAGGGDFVDLPAWLFEPMRLLNVSSDFDGEKRPMVKAASKATSIDDDFSRLHKASTAALDALIPGSADFDVRDVATRAVLRELTSFAQYELFPDYLRPASHAVLLDFELWLSACERLEPITTPAVRLHQQSLDGGYMEMTEFLRGPRGRRLVIARAREANLGAPDVAEARAIARFVSAVAGQLKAEGLFEPWSSCLVDVVPGLTGRLEAIEAEHHRLVETERQRIAAEAEAEAARQAAAAEAERRKEWPGRLACEDREARRRREDLADQYRGHARFRFVIEGRQMSGLDAAEELLAGAPFRPLYAALMSGMIEVPR
jgi:hypothetical protein